MNLVMLTNSYPYGDQEAFIEPEIRVMENRFDEIHILTLAKPGMSITRYIPSNAKITLVREFKTGNLNSKLSLLSPTTIKEFIFVRKNYKYSWRSCISLQLNFYGKSYSLFKPFLVNENIENTIFYSYWFSHLSYALAKFKKVFPNAICISRAHRVDNFIDFKASLYRNYILSNLNGIYPISLEGLNEIKNRMLPYAIGACSEIKVFHLGVDLYDSINPDKESNVFNIVSCSFIHRIKRIDIIIDALSSIDNINIHWIHFGSGDMENEIKGLAEDKLGKKSNIDFEFRGQTSHNEILEYYTNHHVDLFINSSDHEGIPVSVMEAMAAGILCVARDVGGNRELIDDHDNGFLLDSNAKSIDYANVINTVYNLDPLSIKSIKKNAMIKVKNDFSSPKVYEDFANHIISLFENSNSEEIGE